MAKKKNLAKRREKWGLRREKEEKVPRAAWSRTSITGEKLGGKKGVSKAKGTKKS